MNVLALNAQKALDFFLQSKQYHGFILPEYFDFDALLNSVKNAVGDKSYEDCIKAGVSPEQFSDVSLNILLNKDGKYAVRPIVLANPVLYYFLAREICNEDAWTQIKALFKKFTVPHLTSCAIPVIPNEKKEKFRNATTIFNWWNSLEQRSIELSLEYRYMFVTDITNCYGSVNPQTFDWAFKLKNTQYEVESENQIAKNIQKYLCALQQGRNIGIPQGSALFDILGEIILGYSDLLLHEAIQKDGISAKYEILRYRDDYRIFCNDRDALEKISYHLQHVLELLNFRMNSKKTMISESIVTDSIKKDKLEYIYNTPIFSKKGVDFDSFEKHLLFILRFSRDFPDSGSIKTLLSDFDNRIEEYVKEKFKKDSKEDSKEKQKPVLSLKYTPKTIDKIEADKVEDRVDNPQEIEDFNVNSIESFLNEKEDLDNINFQAVENILNEGLDDIDFDAVENVLKEQNEFSNIDPEKIEEAISKQNIFGPLKVYQPRENSLPGGSVRAMSAICVQIAIENVGCCHYALKVLSRMVDILKDEDEKGDIIDLVYAKLCKQPNSDYNQLWLQNMTYQQDKKLGESRYTMKLCRLVAGDKSVKIWNNEWLKDEIVDNINEAAIIDGEILKNVTPVITFKNRIDYQEIY